MKTQSRLLLVVSLTIVVGSAFLIPALIISTLAIRSGAITATPGNILLSLSRSILVDGLGLAAGILGLLSWRRPDKSFRCIAAGTVLLVVHLIFGTFSVGGLVRLTLIALYLVGAVRLQKLAEEKTIIPPHIEGHRG